MNNQAELKITVRHGESKSWFHVIDSEDVLASFPTRESAEHFIAHPYCLECWEFERIGRQLDAAGICENCNLEAMRTEDF